MILEKHGYQVRAGEGVSEVYKELQDGEVDAVLLDIKNPDTDIPNEIANIRQFSTAPIIVLSTISKPEATRQALQAEASAYILKPLQTQLLLDEIARLLP